MTPTLPPTLADLTARFLARKSETPVSDDTSDGDVEPHEVVAGFRIEPRVCWNETVATLKLLGVDDAGNLVPPPEWAAYVGLLPTAFAVPLAVGFYPQRVRDFHPLLGTTDLSRFLPTAYSPAPGFVGLRGWVRSGGRTTTGTAALLASGVAANLGDSVDAASGLEAAESRTGTDALALENQKAAIAWATGRHAEALAIWEAMPESTVTSFNRGMALLFLGRSDEAAPFLKQAADELPADTGWSHLAKLYGSLARTRI